MSSLFSHIQGQSPSSRLDVGLVLRLLTTHPGRQNFRWFKAYESPSLDTTTRATPQEGKVIRVEQSPTVEPFLGIFDAHRTSKTLRDAFGSLDESSTTLVYIPEVTPLALGDHVLPWGKLGDGSDVPQKIYQQVITRGVNKVDGAGRVAITGANLTCTLAHGLYPGDIVHILGDSHTVLTTPTTTTATLTPAVGSPVTNLTWELGRDWVDTVFPKRIESMAISNGSGGITILDQAMPLRSSIDDVALGFSDPGTGSKRCWVDWSSDPTRLDPGENYTIRVEGMPLYRVAEGGLQLSGWDYQSIYSNLKSPVIKTPQSLPLMATLSLVVR